MLFQVVAVCDHLKIMPNKSKILDQSKLDIVLSIEDLIIELRGQNVLIDSDIASLYGVTTKRLNEQVKRNQNRFPSDFMFRLTKEEKNKLLINFQRFNKLKYSNSNPNAFTEHGAIMLASILNSEIAVHTSIQIVRAFTKMRSMLATNQDLAKKINNIEEKLSEHDSQIKDVIAVIKSMILPDKASNKKIGFNI
ncbi:MAG: ORF6N domain-containing protein [Proteobacteria bacterium]|nr:ORF6N domain-containing protein [Pseudomonadota bacterium]